jgi:hypothetical protein
MAVGVSTVLPKGSVCSEVETLIGRVSARACVDAVKEVVRRWIGLWLRGRRRVGGGI